MKQSNHYHLGVVSINMPPSYGVFALIAFLIVSIMLVFTWQAAFTEHVEVRGYVSTAEGTVDVYPKRLGIVTKSFVQQGQIIHKGALLFQVDTSIDGMNLHSSPILHTLELRKKLLLRELAYKQRYRDRLFPLLKKKYVSEMMFHRVEESISALEERLNVLHLDMIKLKQSNTQSIRAPITGRIASIMVHSGDHVLADKAVLKLIPEKAGAVVELFVPAAKVGFLQKGGVVVVRYDAYPYQRFGSALATIQSISKMVLVDSEEHKPIQIKEPYYKVIAALKKPVITYYGITKPIYHGMTLSATLLGAKKKIWQWILDPMYSYFGRVFL